MVWYVCAALGLFASLLLPRWFEYVLLVVTTCGLAGMIYYQRWRRVSLTEILDLTELVRPTVKFGADNVGESKHGVEGGWNHHWDPRTKLTTRLHTGFPGLVLLLPILCMSGITVVTDVVSPPEVPFEERRWNSAQLSPIWSRNESTLRSKCSALDSESDDFADSTYAALVYITIREPSAGSFTVWVLASAATAALTVRRYRHSATEEKVWRKRQELLGGSRVRLRPMARAGLGVSQVHTTAVADSMETTAPLVVGRAVYRSMCTRHSATSCLGRAVRRCHPVGMTGIPGLHSVGAFVALLGSTASYVTNSSTLLCALHKDTVRVLVAVAFKVLTMGTALYVVFSLLTFVWWQYAQARVWALQLGHSRVDLTDPESFYSWWRLRQYYTRWRIPAITSAGGIGIVVMGLYVIEVVAFVTFQIVVNGDAGIARMLASSGQQTQIVNGLILGLFVLAILSYAADIWYQQQQHAVLLERTVQVLRTRRCLGTSRADTGQFESLLSGYVQLIRQHDVPPHVAGIPVTPTLRNVLWGYLATAVVTTTIARISATLT